MNDGTVEGLTASKASLSMDEGQGGAFLSAMKHSNEVFAAFKVHDMGKSMASRLYTADGQLKPFTSWVKEVMPIASHHTRAWLRTEYNTAVIRAHNAADWQEFERNKDVMPNLRWMPTTSPTPEGSHAAFWQKKLTLPVDDPFWAKHHPGDRWNCKCSLEAVDTPVNRSAIEEGDVPAPQRGLENNPGKDGHIFNDTHPYFPNSCATCDFYRHSNIKNKVRVLLNATQKKNCYNCPYIDGCIERTQEIKKQNKERAKELKKEAAFLVDTKFTNPDFVQDVRISQKRIKEWLNQPHEHYREKNEALLNLENLFNSATYKGSTIDDKDRKDVVRSHIFEIKIKGDISSIIVHEMTWGEYWIHSISDKQIIKK